MGPSNGTENDYEEWKNQKESKGDSYKNTKGTEQSNVSRKMEKGRKKRMKKNFDGKKEKEMLKSCST